ncbi:MAG: ATP-binding protein [Nitrospirota bacterium]|nr:ATP-binding protein [Nitrospirota bacterium]
MDKNVIVQKALLINKNSKDSLLLEQAFGSCCPHTLTVIAGDAEAALEIMMRERVDTVFIDYPLIVQKQDFFRELRRGNVGAPVIVIIDKGKELQAAEAIKEGAYDYLVRDSDYSIQLKNVIRRIQSATIPEKESEGEQGQGLLIFEQIYRSQKWWQNIIDAITDYLFVIDSEYRILRTNKAFADLFDKEPADIIMRPYYELYGLKGPHEWCMPEEQGGSLSPRSLERKINDTVYLISSFPIFHDKHRAVVYIMKDITETRRLKDQVYHLDKLSSLGTLTSGVAHEINNPLTGIIGYTEMLLMQEQAVTTKKYLKNIYDSAIRCKRIVENMLTFSRQTPAQMSPEKINDIIDKTIELHEYWLKTTNIEIVRDYADVPCIGIDRQQMQQVILNLLINAEHAVSDCGRKGVIGFRTECDRELKKIIVTVSDNGSGIHEDVLPRIFDPFFTTKPVNVGTGLGLSITHGIIAEQGGTIECRSVPGKGTSFIITFPMEK